MAAGVSIRHKRKTSNFTNGELAAGEFGLNTNSGVWFYSVDGVNTTSLQVGVTSFNGRTGAISPASGDYSAVSETLSNKILSAPKMTSGTSLFDANGNELIKFPSAVASAVNEITVNNAATGNAPSVEATGNDTNIDLNLKSKGTGKVKANSVEITTISGTQTLTNKRVTKRTASISSSATPAFNTDNADLLIITALAADITDFSTNLIGTPVEGDLLRIIIVPTATRSIVWGSKFEASTIALPPSVTTTTDYGFRWNTTTSKWRICAIC